MVAELLGGVLLILGLLTPLAGLALVLVCVGAAVFVHGRNGVFVDEGGWELVGGLGSAALLLAAGGAGRFSLDHLMFGRRRERAHGWPPRPRANGTAARSRRPSPSRRRRRPPAPWKAGPARDRPRSCRRAAEHGGRPGPEELGGGAAGSGGRPPSGAMGIAGTGARPR